MCLSVCLSFTYFLFFDVISLSLPLWRNPIGHGHPLVIIIIGNNSRCGHLVLDCGCLIHYHGCHHHVHDHGCWKPHLDILCMIFFFFLIFKKLKICTSLHKGFTLTFTWIYIILHLYLHGCEWKVYTNVGQFSNFFFGKPLISILYASMWKPSLFLISFLN